MRGQSVTGGGRVRQEGAECDRRGQRVTGAGRVDREEGRVTVGHTILYTDWALCRRVSEYSSGYRAGAAQEQPGEGTLTLQA